MKNFLSHYFLLICLLVIANGSFAQTDSAKQKVDSVNSKLLLRFTTKLDELATQRSEDSSKKEQLQLQLSALKAPDSAKKTALQQELEQLKQKETIRLAEKKAKIDSLRSTANGFAVTGFFNDTLFFLYSKLGSFTASDRADAISARIKKLADNFHFNTDSLKAAESETTFDILFGDKIIMSVSENDALWNNTEKQVLAEKYRQVIGTAVMRYQRETSVTSLLKEIGLALLVLVILIVIIFYVNKFFRWVTINIKSQEDIKVKGIKIRNYTLLDARKQIAVLTFVTAVINWIVILVLIYIALPILFGIFPWTRGFATTLMSYFLNPIKKILLSLWNYLPNLITIIVIIVVFRYLLKGVNYLKKEVETGALKISGFYSDWANPTYQIARVLLLAFMLIVIFPYMPGSDSPIFRGISVFIGVLFTFGSAGALSNIMSGLVLTYMRAFKIGDRIKIGDVTGDIIEKSLLVTRIRTIKNEIISIPNSNVMSSHTINYSSEAMEKGLIMHTTVTIGYDVPWKQMHQALIDAALRTEHLLKEPIPFVLQTSLDDFYVSYQVNAYTNEPNKQAIIYSHLHQHIQDCCNEAGIEILSPHYRAARDGNATTIPTDYLSKDYTAPAFNLKVQTGSNEDKGKNL